MAGIGLIEEDLHLIFEMRSEMSHMKFRMEQMEHKRIFLNIFFPFLGIGPSPPVTSNPDVIVPLAQNHKDAKIFEKNQSHGT